MRLNGIAAPVGTILGPDWSGMILVVENTDETGVTLRGARSSDFALVSEARSLTEHNMMQGAGTGWMRAIRTALQQPKVHEGEIISGKVTNG